MKANLKDLYLKNELNNLFKKVIKLPDNLNPYDVREFCSRETTKIFSKINYIIKGSENLPYEQNSIFIYNHLNNPIDYSVSTNFQITLDSHFISSLILYKYYNNAGNRVVRCSLENELAHKNYYEKFDYIRVFAERFIPKTMNYKQVKEFNKGFYSHSIDNLKKGVGIIVSPEGFSLKTEESPGIFKLGVFKLATIVKPEPKIVPVVMANFDKLLSKSLYKCEIMKPFKMSDHGIYGPNDPKLLSFIEGFNDKYKRWVKNLIIEDLNFELEIQNLEKSIENQKDLIDPIVFYGSSTIRLWKGMKNDFNGLNVINLGFGGALIKDLSKNFSRLFRKIKPSVIVLYLGGNDLTLGYSAEKIVKKIRKFLELVFKNYPNIKIINMSIKPSFERINDIKKIEKINSLMTAESSRNKNLIQLNFYEKIINKGVINQSLYLRDGLHFNDLGYKILVNEVKLALKNII
ncbi:MAG: GDSL-type esterase/lipase family protein [Flavobacteriaceae bacterium]